MFFDAADGVGDADVLAAEFVPEVGADFVAGDVIEAGEFHPEAEFVDDGGVCEFLEEDDGWG